MTSSVPPGPLRQAYSRLEWGPLEPYGEDGWMIVRKDRLGSVIVSVARFEDGHEWVHASVNFRDRMPTYEDLQQLHRAIGRRWAVQVFAPPEAHINITVHALHLWARLDGARVHPDFGHAGTI